MLNISKKHHNLITPELQTVSGGGGGEGSNHISIQNPVCAQVWGIISKLIPHDMMFYLVFAIFSITKTFYQ